MTQTYISLDLETTGLDPESDEVVEVAAVKFQGEKVLATFHSLVNPERPLPYRCQVLCNLSPKEVAAAPLFEAIASQLRSFLDTHPLVGHSVSFDLAFLSARGLRLPNPIYDTHELARVLLPRLLDYSLSSVARELGLARQGEHRALPDALTAREAFLALKKRASELDPSLLSEMAGLAQRSPWPLGQFFWDLSRAQAKPPGGNSPALKPARPEEPLPPSPQRKPLEIERLKGFSQPGGLLEQAFPGYEHRPEQVRMMEAVARALNEGQHLLVEAGTGTGKSMAYLLPALLFATQNNLHIVISTNTINLQEQLIHKDIPDLLRALRTGEDLKAVTLKGRTNYLCLRRWQARLEGEVLSPGEARFLARLLVWLKGTETGDRAELSLSGEEATLWAKVSALGEECLTSRCPHHRQGTCFLHRAREAAESAHIVVTNHALLLSDTLTANKVLPPYSHLIIDEAHHLEEEATEQLGFRLSPGSFSDYLDRLSGVSSGLLLKLRDSLKGAQVPRPTKRSLEHLQEGLERQVAQARRRLSEFFDLLSRFLESHAQGGEEYERHLRLTPASRAQSLWSRVEMAGENLNLSLKDIEENLGRLYSGLEPLPAGGVRGEENLLLEISSLLEESERLCSRLGAVVSHPEADTIYWGSLGPEGTVSLSAAPLEVGPLLRRSLFSEKESLILTGATLSTEGTFGYLKRRLGLDYAEELLLGTPFDYLNSALIFHPHDLPEPQARGYQEGLEKVLLELCLATKGHALALFTSHAALRATYAAIKGPLEEEGVLVLGQGIDGSPRQLVEFLKINPRTVLLGTASLWEGIDVAGEALSLLVIARLPFNVPTDPVFAARSETCDDPFNEYGLPQAILKFKQGFGRLIRTRTDRGAMVVLDRRLHSKRYGRAFLASLPPCPVIKGPSRQAPLTVAEWLERDSGRLYTKD